MKSEDKELKQELIEKAYDQAMEQVESQVKSLDSLPPDVIPENRIRLMVQMAALGMGPVKIAKKLKMTKQKASMIMQSSSFQEAVSTLQDDIKRDSTKIFKSLVLDAIQVANQVMNDPKEKGSVKAEVAFKFMDRALGKPTQEIKHEGGMLRELIQMMDANKPKEVVEDAEWWDIRKKGETDA